MRIRCLAGEAHVVALPDSNYSRRIREFQFVAMGSALRSGGCEQRIGHEGIAPAFVTESRFWSMTGNEHHIIAERPQP